MVQLSVGALQKPCQYKYIGVLQGKVERWYLPGCKPFTEQACATLHTAVPTDTALRLQLICTTGLDGW
jgi:hypothetical protein